MRTERHFKNVIRYLILAAAVCCVTVLTGCNEKQIDVSVRENNITTRLAVPDGQTVQEVLTEAELSVGDKDEVVPALSEPVTGENNEITIKRYAQVTVVDEDDTHEVEVFGGTVDDALEEAGVSLDEDDRTDVSREAYLQDGMTVTVTRVRNVALTVNGKTHKVKTSARTVADLFEEESVEVGKHDRLNVKQKDKIKEGMKIVLDLVSTKEETVTEDIPYTTQTKYSASMNKGTSTVSRAGVNGKKEVTYRVTYVNGQEEKRVKVGEKTVQQPVAQIVTQGTKAVRTVVSKQKVLDCDGSGHGYYIIKYSDGTTSYQNF